MSCFDPWVWCQAVGAMDTLGACLVVAGLCLKTVATLARARTASSVGSHARKSVGRLAARPVLSTVWRRRLRRPAAWALIRACLVAAAAAACLTAGWASVALAYTPETPVVRQAVDRAIKFLESDAADDKRLGARAVVGLALLKHGADADHPKVVGAVRAIQGRLGRMNPQDLEIDIYSTGLSIIFLCELDPSKYRAEIECLLEYLRLRQKPHGGWGYPDRETGDTSMTQYGVLSSWEAKQAGFDIPRQMILAVTLWLLKTQDPSGGFGYQGVVSDSFRLVPQKRVGHGVTAAGLGSVYICADLLGLVDRVQRREDELPPALSEVVEAQPAGPPKPKLPFDPLLLAEAQRRGNRWMFGHYKIDPEGFTHYYLYALERYHSFREVAEKRNNPEPDWYNDGVRYLLTTQADDGTWESRCGKTVDTAFGALFLMRSMKKSIERARAFAGGRLRAAQGLPLLTQRVAVRNGRVVAVPDVQIVGRLLPALNDSSHPRHREAVELLGALPPAQAPELVGTHQQEIVRLVRHQSARVRLAAVRILGAGERLEVVPTLVFALSDPDAEVMLEARDALRRLARKPEGFGLSNEPDAAAIQKAVERWQTWYLGVCPDAVFPEPFDTAPAAGQ